MDVEKRVGQGRVPGKHFAPLLLAERRGSQSHFPDGALGSPELPVRPCRFWSQWAEGRAGSLGCARSQGQPKPAACDSLEAGPPPAASEGSPGLRDFSQAC